MPLKQYSLLSRKNKLNILQKTASLRRLFFILHYAACSLSYEAKMALYSATVVNGKQKPVV